jgi:hypothetical protein
MRLRWLALVALVALVAAGCAQRAECVVPDGGAHLGGTCGDEIYCADGTLCRHTAQNQRTGICIAVCDEFHPPCPDGQLCVHGNSGGALCEKICQSNSDCPSNQMCDPGTSSCVSGC